MIFHQTFPLIVACVIVLRTSLSSGQDNYVADIRFYVDGPAFQKLRSRGVESQDDMVREIEDLVQLLNTKYFSSLSRNGLNLQIRLEKVIYQEMIVPGENGKIQANAVVKRFEDFLVDNDIYESSFDAAMLLTGLDMYSGNSSGTAGMAHVGTVCYDIYRSGTSEVLGDITYTASIVAHELGHIFGANHDTPTDCPNGDYKIGNVMFPSLSFGNPNMFDFSACSANFFMKKFSELKDNCMLDDSNQITQPPITRPPTTRPPTTRPPTTRTPRTQPPTTRPPRTQPPTTQNPDASDYETPDEACQRIAGEDHSFYRPYYAVAGYGHTFCRLLRCISHTSKKVSRYYTPDGIPCGTDKRCNNGRCVYADNTPFNESCPWGDQDFRDMKLRTCSKYSCGTNNWQNNYCCTYCATVKSYKFVRS